MALFAFAIGLTLRRDSQILEFRRTFENREVQFEDPLSGRLYSWSIEKIYREINNGELSIVSVTTTEATPLTEKIPQTLLSLESLPTKYKDELERRIDYINTAKKQGLTKGRRRQLNPLILKIATRRNEPAPSTSTVMSWWRTLDQYELNPSALVSRNFKKRRSRSLPDETIDVIRMVLRKEYFTRDRHPLSRSYLLIKRALKSMPVKPIPTPEVSISSVRRIANEVGPYYKDLARFGPAYARNRWRYSLGGVTPTRVLERVEVDHTQLDIVVICDRSGLPLGRPTITVIIDAYSGYVISFFVSFWGPGLGPTLNAMKIAVSPKDAYYQGNTALSNPWLGYGLFELAVVDNGLEFHSPQFKLAAWHLNTDIQYCAVRQPWLKPCLTSKQLLNVAKISGLKIEHFRVIQDCFCKLAERQTLQRLLLTTSKDKYLYRFCPQCWSEDKIPYFRIEWRFRHGKYCLKHQSELRSECPSCGKVLAMHRALLGGTYKPPPVPDLATCLYCRANLRANVIEVSQFSDCRAEVVNNIAFQKAIISAMLHDHFFIQPFTEKWSLDEMLILIESVGLEVPDDRSTAVLDQFGLEDLITLRRVISP